MENKEKEELLKLFGEHLIPAVFVATNALFKEHPEWQFFLEYSLETGNKDALANVSLAVANLIINSITED